MKKYLILPVLFLSASLCASAQTENDSGTWTSLQVMYHLYSSAGGTAGIHIAGAGYNLSF